MTLRLTFAALLAATAPSVTVLCAPGTSDAATLHALGADGKLRAIDTDSRKAGPAMAVTGADGLEQKPHAVCEDERVGCPGGGGSYAHRCCLRKLQLW